MSREELISALGTIANSGTRAFLDKLGKEKDAGFIGQFGVGFYSAFMVADHVEVATRRAGQDQAWLWTFRRQGLLSDRGSAARRGARRRRPRHAASQRRQR